MHRGIVSFKMADSQQLALIRQGPKKWNQWRKTNRLTIPDLSAAYLPEANLSAADLSAAYLNEVFLIKYLAGSSIVHKRQDCIVFSRSNQRQTLRLYSHLAPHI